MSFKSFLFPAQFNRAAVILPLVGSAVFIGKGLLSAQDGNTRSAVLDFTTAAFMAMISKTVRGTAVHRAEAQSRVEDLNNMIGEAVQSGASAIYVDMGEGPMLIIIQRGQREVDPNVIDVETRVIPDVLPAPERK